MRLPLIVSAFLILLFSIAAAAQGQDQTPQALVKQGTVLNDSGKYDQAIEKYKQAIKADPLFENAYYEMGYTLSAMGKGDEAIPYLEKLLAIDPKSAGGYDMLASIYDDKGQQDKAEVYYKQGIDADSTYQRLHFNLGILYFRQKKYAEAEKRAIEAIKLAPAHASSHRLFAMVAYEQGKRGASLLAWNNFLILEPQTKRSAVAVAYIKNILNHGITRKDGKNVNVATDGGNPGTLLMQLAAINATQGVKDLAEVDSVQLQLTELFKVAHGIADDKAEPFISNYYSDFFESLAQSGNMAAFAHYILLSTAKHDEYLNWLKTHRSEVDNLDAWMKKTDRKF